MNRPPGLPSRDARTPESIKNSKFLVSGIEGMVDTPTAEQLKALDESIDRKLQARWSVDDIAKELCDVQPMSPGLIAHWYELIKNWEKDIKETK